MTDQSTDKKIHTSLDLDISNIHSLTKTWPYYTIYWTTPILNLLKIPRQSMGNVLLSVVRLLNDLLSFMRFQTKITSLKASISFAGCLISSFLLDFSFFKENTILGIIAVNYQPKRVEKREIDYSWTLHGWSIFVKFIIVTMGILSCFLT